MTIAQKPYEKTLGNSTIEADGPLPLHSENPSTAQRTLICSSLTPASIRNQAIELIASLAYKGVEVLVTLILK